LLIIKLLYEICRGLIDTAIRRAIEKARLMLLGIIFLVEIAALVIVFRSANVMRGLETAQFFFGIGFCLGGVALFF